MSDIANWSNEETACFVTNSAQLLQKGYPCPDCEKLFMSVSSLRRHYRIHSGDLFPCDKCSKKFQARADMKKHVKAVHDSLRCTCTRCNKEYKLTKVAQQNGAVENFCTRCNSKYPSRKFEDFSAISGADYLDKSGEDMDSSNKSRDSVDLVKVEIDLVDFSAISGADYLDKSGESMDLVDLTSKAAAEKQNASNDSIQLQIHEQEDMFSCQFCSKKFLSQEYLDMHEETHAHPLSFVCDDCGATYEQQSALLEHEQNHHNIHEGVVL